MKAIVLAPGPSLANYVEQPADIVVGVNRAACKVACTHWCCGDTPLVENIAEQVIGTPVLVTYEVTADTLNDHQFYWRQGVERWSPIAESWLHTSVVNWPWCSFCAAIVYAAWKGATEIACYGCDWDGKTDWDGVEAGKNRSEDRWREERGLFGALQKVLGERGHNITRHVTEAVVGRV